MPNTKASQSVGRDYAEELAVAALQYLAQDGERLSRFLALSGLGPHNLREAAAEPGFLGCLLDHLASDERLLISFAESRNVKPEVVSRAREALAGPEPNWT